MRTDTATFAAHNATLAKEPRFVIEVAFDTANTILRYFTSHDDAALPGGAVAVARVVKNQSVSSQRLSPDDAAATIGAMEFDLVDRGGAITALLAGQISLGRSTRQMRVRFYVGYQGDAWADYSLVQTQLIQQLSFNRGSYHFSCSDIQRSLRKDICDHAKTNLSASLGATRLTAACAGGAGTLNVVDTSMFPTAGTGIALDTDANDEDFFAWTGKTATTLTGITGILAHGGGAGGLAAVTICDATVNVYNTAQFSMVAHGTSFGDSPSATVGYVTVEKEIIKYGSKTSTSYTNCVRGALGSFAVAHEVDATLAQDKRPLVEEYIYLEMPAPKLIYALLTGVLYNQGGATLPAGWHLGIDPNYVRLADFTDPAKVDLWNPADDQQGVMARFEGVKKTDGKKFIETELYRLCGSFPPIYANGQIGFKRMANILSGAGYVAVLNKSNLVSWSELTHDFRSLHNVFRIDWNWDPLQEKFLFTNVFADVASITTYYRADSFNLQMKGLHGSRTTAATLGHLFNALRDRYTGPPLEITVEGLHRLNGLEVGDVVRLTLDNVRDYLAPNGGGPIDRSFEVQQITVDWKGKVSLALFGSSQAPSSKAPSDESVVLADAWYTSAGTALTTTGSAPKHISSNVTLNGTADMNAAGSIFYCDGDLQIDVGVVVTITGNVQLRAKGFIQNNGTITGKGGGKAGAAPGTPAAPGDFVAGTAGFLGTTEAMGGVFNAPHGVLTSLPSVVVQGANSTVPALNLDYDGTTLAGIPADLRGTSGSTGGSAGVQPNVGALRLMAGGAGGASGAALLLACRGFAQAPAARVDLSGADGVVGQGFSGAALPGSGAGGAPGAFVVILDGVNQAATDVDDVHFVALQGKTPISPLAARLDPPVWTPSSGQPLLGSGSYSFYDGSGDGNNKAVPNLSGARGGARIQYVPGNQVAQAAPFVPLVFGFDVVDGTLTSQQVAQLTLTGGATGNIALGTVTGGAAGNVASATITAANLVNATITATQIANLTITATQIANLTITAAQIANATITGGKIDNATIVGGNIANATITNSQIAASTITGSNIAGATITAGNMVAGTITAASGIIADINADTITSGSIRGINVNAASHTTKGSYLTLATSGGDGTVNVKNTADFASSGTAIVIDTTNNLDSFTYSGKTGTTLTGCSGVLAHNSGATIVPVVDNIVIDKATNRLLVYGNPDAAGVRLIASFGTNPLTGWSGEVEGLSGYSNGSGIGLAGSSDSGQGVVASSVSGNAVWIGGNATKGNFRLDDCNGSTFPTSKTAGQLAQVNNRLYYADGSSWLPLTQPYFQSSEQTITNNGSLTIAHGLGFTPQFCSLVLVNKTAEFNWAVGDRVQQPAMGYFSGAGRGCAVWLDSTNINVRFGDGVVFDLLDKNSGSAFGMDITKWKAVFRAW